MNNTDVTMDFLALKFRDAELEKRFLSHDYFNTLSSTRLALALTPLFYFGYSLFDYLLFGSECWEMVYIRAATVLCSTPLIVYSFFKRFAKIQQILLGAVMFVYGVTMAIGLTLYDAQYALYFVSGCVMINTYTALLMNLRFRSTFLLVWLVSGICFAALVYKDLPFTDLFIGFHILFTMGLFIVMGIYKFELGRRKEFIQAQKLLYQAQALAESERSRVVWFERTTKFLRHELKNAIRGMSSSLEVFQRFNPDFKDDKYIKRSLLSVSLSNKLLDNMGDATGLEAALAKEERYAIALDVLLQEYVDHYKATIGSHSLAYSGNVREAIVNANSERLIEALDNLVTNAIDHSPENTTIDLSLTYEQGQAVISVENEGSLLPERSAELFDAFVSQRHNDKKRRDNMGVGLFMVKTIIECYGGYVHAENKECGGGVIFSFSLPIA